MVSQNANTFNTTATCFGTAGLILSSQQHATQGIWLKLTPDDTPKRRQSTNLHGVKPQNSTMQNKNSCNENMKTYIQFLST
jgi:hypothetical protein